MDFQILVSELVIKIREFYGSVSRPFRILLLGLIIGFIPVYFGIRYTSYWIYTISLRNVVAPARPAFSDPLSLVVGDVTVVPAGGGVVAAVVAVENPNFELALESGTYTFQFFNAVSSLVATESGTFYMHPDAKTHLVATRNIEETRIIRATVTIVADKWIKRFPQLVPKVTLRTTPPTSQMEEDPKQFIVTGGFANNSPHSIAKVRLVILVRDKTGTILAASNREERNIASGEPRSIRQVWPSLEITQENKIDVFAETNTFDPNNIFIP